MTLPEKVAKKQSHRLPDRQLAEAFSFTSEDLAVNRLGFMTGVQRWNIPMLYRPLVQAIFDLLPSRQRDRVETICGRLSLTIQDGDNLHSGMRRKHFIAHFEDGSDMRFLVTEAQYNLLARQQGLIYRAYYVCHNAYNCRLLSLERVTDGC